MGGALSSFVASSAVLAILAAPPAGAPVDPPQGPDAPAASDTSVGRLSSGGTDNGALELGLGSAALVIGLGLVVAGSFDLKRGLDRKRQCDADPFTSSCTIDAPGLVFASVGLAWGFSIPALVGGGLLLRRGARIHRDHRQFHRLASQAHLSLWFDGRRRGNGGVNLRLRF